MQKIEKWKNWEFKKNRRFQNLKNESRKVKNLKNQELRNSKDPKILESEIQKFKNRIVGNTKNREKI